MEKINIAELLKDCPNGMELDCTLYDNCTFEEIEDVGYIYIVVNTPSGRIRLSKEGCYIRYDKNSKCVIFPKGKNTWEGFQRPFKNGDIVRYMDAIAIFKEWGDETLFRTYVATYLCCDPLIDVKVPFYGKSVRKEIRLATEKEKEKLFQTIKDNGYQWNSKTKTLEKLIKPKFKVGDKIVNDDYVVEIIDMDIEGEVYGYKSKVGATGGILFIEQDEWELVPNKFDINSLIPFKSKVLVRDSNVEKWRPATWGYYDIDSKYNYPYEVVGGHGFSMCIPYEGNSHLMGKTDDCDEFYKTW